MDARICLLLFDRVSFSLDYPAAPQIYTLSLHDALPISGFPRRAPRRARWRAARNRRDRSCRGSAGRDRKSTRLNSSHTVISYAVLCLKKKSVNIYPLIHAFAAHLLGRHVLKRADHAMDG